MGLYTITGDILTFNNAVPQPLAVLVPLIRPTSWPGIDQELENFVKGAQVLISSHPPFYTTIIASDGGTNVTVLGKIGHLHV